MVAECANALRDFIANIPANRLMNPPSHYKDANYYLRVKCITTGEPQCYDLQIVANRDSKIKTVSRMGGIIVAGPVLVPVSTTPDPEEIRAQFMSIKKF